MGTRPYVCSTYLASSAITARLNAASLATASGLAWCTSDTVVVVANVVMW